VNNVEFTLGCQDARLISAKKGWQLVHCIRNRFRRSDALRGLENRLTVCACDVSTPI
jgi:hypothetical protein